MAELDLRYVAEQTLALCRIPSPTGFTEGATSYLESEFARLGLPVRRTAKGALVATFEGQDKERQRAIAAHVDTLGAMVKEIKPNGRLRFTRIGGYACTTVEGEHVLVHTHQGRTVSGTILVTRASTHVHGPEHDKQERTEQNMEIRLDERVSSAADVEALGLQVGDFVSLDPRATMTETGYIKSRHLDDKACAAILLGIAKYIQEEKIPLAATTHLFFSNYEEVGHGAAGAFPSETAELIALDMAAVGEGQTSDEYSVTVCVKDSSGPYDYDLSRRLQNLARSAAIPVRIDIYPYYASDASAALRAGAQFRTALVGPGIDSSHSYERCHLDGLKSTALLLLEYLRQ